VIIICLSVALIQEEEGGGAVSCGVCTFHCLSSSSLDSDGQVCMITSWASRSKLVSSYRGCV
jgi:hypothetical protein